MQNVQEIYDKKMCKLLAIVMSLPFLTNFFGSISNTIAGITSLSTYPIYAIVFGMFLLNYRLKGKRIYYFIMLTSLVLGVFLINRMLFYKSYLYSYSNREVLIRVLIFYYPVMFGMMTIKNWKPYFHYMRYTAFWTPFLCWVAKEFFGLLDLINYMNLSNALLPGFLAAWYIARVDGNKKFYISSVFSLYMQLLYGGRMSFASGITFIILLEIIILSKNKGAKGIVKVTILSVIAIISFFFYKEILEAFLLFLDSLNIKSRTIRNIINGTIFESETRAVIYERARHEISHLGMKMYGLFGDRVAFEKYGGILYVHNIFYEMILSFGWIFGGVIIFLLVKQIIKKCLFEKNTMKKIMATYFFCQIFLRLLVSGSFILEGQFWLLIGVLCNNCFDDDTEKNSDLALEENQYA